MHTRLLRGLKSSAFIAASLMLALSARTTFAQQQQQNNFNSNPNGGNPNFNTQQDPADVPMTHYTGREHGSLGVPLSDNRHGDVWVSTVVPNSPADRAGLRPGDQILAFGNQPIHSYREAVHAINLQAPYALMAIHVRRNGHDGTLTASLMPHQAPGDRNNATAMPSQGPGYFQDPQRGTMHTYVAPMQGYANAGSSQTTFNNAQQAGYNQQQQGGNGGQGANGGQDGNGGQGFRPFKVVAPPVGFDPNQSKQGIWPTGPTF
ncbi:MAG TPA: PDZ domain-containing protein [Pirellulales bacterium]